jgi:hypothetical protein
MVSLFATVNAHLPLSFPQKTSTTLHVFLLPHKNFKLPPWFILLARENLTPWFSFCHLQLQLASMVFPFATISPFSGRFLFFLLFFLSHCYSEAFGCGRRDSATVKL